MDVYVQHDPADLGLDLPGRMIARSAEGLDSVEIRLRWDGRTGTRKALLMLARAAVEVCVRAREIPAPEPGRTFILAGSWAEGVEKARSLGVRPHAKTTLIITRPEGTRGHRLRATDVVVLARPSASLAEAWRYVEGSSFPVRYVEGSRWNG